MVWLQGLLSSIGIEFQPQLKLDAVVTVLGTVIFGGLAGALVAALIARRRERRDVALKLVDYYMAHYSDLADVLRLLGTPDSLLGSEAADDRNRVRERGDWFEAAAILISNRKADRDLLRAIGITRQIARFRESLVQSFDRTQDTEMRRWLDDRLRTWTAVRDFKP